MISAGRRVRSRRFRLLMVPLVLFPLAAGLRVWLTPDTANTSTPVGAGLRLQPEPTDEPGLTPADDLSAQMQAMRSADDFEPVFRQHPSGAVSVDLGRRFLKMSVATVDADGQVHTSCVDGTAATHLGCADGTTSGRER